jgi:hypothetical protein
LKCSFFVVSSGKSCSSAKAHLPAEHRARAGAGAVSLGRALLEHVRQEVEVLLLARIELHAAGREPLW